MSEKLAAAAALTAQIRPKRQRALAGAERGQVGLPLS